MLPLGDDEIHLPHGLDDFPCALPAPRKHPAVARLELGHLSGLRGEDPVALQEMAEFGQVEVDRELSGFALSGSRDEIPRFEETRVRLLG